MTMRSRRLLVVLAGANALVAALLAIAVNAATSTVPQFLDQHPGRTWTLVGLLTAVAIACAVVAARTGQPTAQEQVPGEGRIGGVHAGGDLTIRGQGHTVVGGDHASVPPPSEQTRRRRG